MGCPAYPGPVTRRPPSGRQLAVAVLVLVLSVSACRAGSEDPPMARPAAPTTSAPTSTTEAPATAVTSSTAPASSPQTPARPAVVLAPDGLGVVRFGAEAEQVLTHLADVLGPANDDRRLGSCPSGAADRLVQFSELAVLIAGEGPSGRFVAWDVGPASGAFPPLATAEGIRVGSTVSELRAAYGPLLELSGDDPFGPAFAVRVPPPGALSGTTTGTGPGDTVTSLGGGRATCAAD